MGWGISQDLLYTFIEVGERGGDWTCVYTSFLTVISSRGYCCRSLDVDGPRFAVLFRHLVLKGKFPNCFPFISSFRLILWDFALSFHGSFAGKCYCL